jgi:hypothetical protein
LQIKLIQIVAGVAVLTAGKFHSACLLLLFSTMKTFTNYDPMS